MRLGCSISCQNGYHEQKNPHALEHGDLGECEADLEQIDGKSCAGFAQCEGDTEPFFLLTTVVAQED